MESQDLHPLSFRVMVRIRVMVMVMVMVMIMIMVESQIRKNLAPETDFSRYPQPWNFP